jgi:signal transduction histidine kinase
MTREPGRPGRRPAIVIVAIAGLAVTAAGLGASIWVNRHDALSLTTDPLLWAEYFSLAVIGAVVMLARPGNRVGWVMLAGGLLSSVGGAALDLAEHDLLRGGTVPGASILAVGGACARTAGWYFATVLLAIYFPDGRAPGGRWRWLLRSAAIGIAFGVFGSLLATHAQLSGLPRWHNPLSTHALNAIADPLSGLSLLVNIVTTVAAVVRLGSRWRHGEPLERQQIGLFAAVAILPIFAVIFGVAGIGAAQVFGAALLPLPIGVGFAVLARGLYDLASAANRTLVWLTLSAAVVGIYAIVIAGLGSALQVPGASWLPWLAAAVVAVSFAPLRDALQRGVNRLTFGRWDDPYQVLAALGQHLEASADVDRLLADVVKEVQATLGLRDVAVVGADGTVLAGEPGLDAHDELALVAYGAPLGVLRYTAAAPLRSGDRHLVDDLAGHLAGLLHARQLTRDLQRARERLVLAREEERRRLRRDLHDGLGPALAGHVLRLELAARQVPAGSPARSGLDTLREEVQATVSEVRRVVEGLRPPALDEVGFAASVTEAALRLTLTTPTRCAVEVGELPPLSAGVEVAAYRIVNEAVTNIVRHADARRCWVKIGAEHGMLQVAVTDDGRGLDGAAPRGHGLETMRERADELGGRLCVRAADPRGTTVLADLPLGARTEPPVEPVPNPVVDPPVAPPLTGVPT